MTSDMIREDKPIGFRRSRLSPEHYFEWRKQRVIPIIDRIELLKDLKGAKILDVGCGFGALSSVLSDRGACVTATEIDQKRLEQAKMLVNNDVRFVKVKNEILPFKDETFDVVVLFDVIEHVSNPEAIIEEVYKTLKPNGLLYVEFTPYYSIVGHHLYDYTKWPIHMLPRGLIKKIVFRKQIKGFQTPNDYWETFKSLNKIRISDFQRMTSCFIKIEERFIVKYPDLFEMNIPLLEHFPFKDLITMSFEGLYRK